MGVYISATFISRKQEIISSFHFLGLFPLHTQNKTAAIFGKCPLAIRYSCHTSSGKKFTLKCVDRKLNIVKFANHINTDTTTQDSLSLFYCLGLDKTGVAVRVRMLCIMATFCCKRCDLLCRQSQHPKPVGRNCKLIVST